MHRKRTGDIAQNQFSVANNDLKFFVHTLNSEVPSSEFRNCISFFCLLVLIL